MTKLLMIYTGGTIGMVQNQDGTLVPFDFENIVGNVPELKRLDYTIDVTSFDPVLDSSNMNPKIWSDLVGKIKLNYDNYDGIVILHGTDTMAYTASALSFMIENLKKPVVLTGSQLPIGEIRTDAKENLITALEIAAAKDEQGNSLAPEVCIYFDFQLLRGNRAKKIHADKFDAFGSTNYPVLAEAGVELHYFKHRTLQPADHSTIFYNRLSTAVASLKVFPGISQDFAEAVINAKNTKAIVLEGFGTGNTHTEKWFTDLLKSAIDDGKIILDISQCQGGAVDIGRYETSRHLRDIGVLSGYDITFEAAITKLMFLLANYNDRNQIKSLLQSNMRGEMSI